MNIFHVVRAWLLHALCAGCCFRASSPAFLLQRSAACRGSVCDADLSKLAVWKEGDSSACFSVSQSDARSACVDTRFGSLADVGLGCLGQCAPDGVDLPRQPRSCRSPSEGRILNDTLKVKEQFFSNGTRLHHCLQNSVAIIGCTRQLIHLVWVKNECLRPRDTGLK